MTKITPPVLLFGLRGTEFHLLSKSTAFCSIVKTLSMIGHEEQKDGATCCILGRLTIFTVFVWNLRANKNLKKLILSNKINVNSKGKVVVKRLCLLNLRFLAVL